MDKIKIAAFYRFASIDDCAAFQAKVNQQCVEYDLRGTMLIAHEGINATLAGSVSGIDAVLAWLQADERFADFKIKISWASEQPYRRLKVKVKNEIIRMNKPDIDPAGMAGERVDALTWNALIDDPDVVVIDTRNDYEVAIGSFPGALDPGTRQFSDLPDWVANQARLASKPKVAMFCTGGIRCEKSTALLRQAGFDRVFHLDGGILNYLETVPPAQNRWQGECFVFDERVSVNSALEPGSYKLCADCGKPIVLTDTRCAECYERA
ncbi:MAG: rhodanese-related sulfurtransferase [Burkholderiaceae bacterium]